MDLEYRWRPSNVQKTRNVSLRSLWLHPLNTICPIPHPRIGEGNVLVCPWWQKCPSSPTGTGSLGDTWVPDILFWWEKNLLLLTCFKSAIEIVVKDDGSMVYATGRHEYPNVRLSVRSLTKDCLQIYWLYSKICTGTKQKNIDT